MASILVVDDDPDVAAVLCAGLEGDGHHVVVAHDGEHALALLAGESFAMLLMDVRLPGMDGLAVVRHIRAQTRWSALRIILLSADDMGRDRARQVGADAYLLKPFRIGEVQGQVRAVLETGA